jgi:hypothetical protein
MRHQTPKTSLINRTPEFYREKLFKDYADVSSTDFRTSDKVCDYINDIYPIGNPKTTPYRGRHYIEDDYVPIKLRPVVQIHHHPLSSTDQIIPPRPFDLLVSGISNSSL